MKFLTLLFPLFLSVESYAIGEWKGTAAYERCHQALNDAKENCHENYHRPNRFARLLFTSDAEHDSFVHVTESCQSTRRDSRPHQIQNYYINYDSVNNVCYFGYVHSPSGKAKMTFFEGDINRAMGTMDFDSARALEDFIQRPDLNEVRTDLQESIHQRRYELRMEQQQQESSNAQGLE